MGSPRVPNATVAAPAGELLGHRGRGRVPRGGPARRDAAGVVQRELQAPDPVRGDVRADDRLGPARLRGGRLLGGEHGNQHYVGLAQDADGLDRDQFGVAGTDADPDEPHHGTLAFALAAVNLAAAAGWPAQWVCR